MGDLRVPGLKTDQLYDDRRPAYVSLSRRKIAYPSPSFPVRSMKFMKDVRMAGCSKFGARLRSSHLGQVT
ncbi:hypothetical protein FVF58_44115 [Paraburkholderia panacisoli]|uniref:Uncharacterized protein n=1 Tax=Paraburkholderia panacisoli TaxID=2603818 RepID=A0A5B0G4W8_9BURK|nr:hypothetical protein [Paraburkholderia panacisoli]KAA0998583.1 hypothetical protein FVF58_44115 [Paraburkholderia panacisoli]